MKKRFRGWPLAAILAFVGLGVTWASLPTPAPTSPLATATPHIREGSGRVVERLPAGSYSYLRVDAEPPDSWLVIMGSAPELGTQLKFRTYALSSDFYSPRLKRRFERLHFTSITPQGTSK